MKNLDLTGNKMWLVRRVLYIVVAIGGIVVVKAGWFPQEVVDQNSEDIVTYLMGALLLFAGAKTGPGSDDPTTKKDLHAQRFDLQEVIDVLTPAIRTQVFNAVNQVANLPYGNHDATTTTSYPAESGDESISGYPG